MNIKWIANRWFFETHTFDLTMQIISGVRAICLSYATWTSPILQLKSVVIWRTVHSQVWLPRFDIISPSITVLEQYYAIYILYDLFRYYAQLILALRGCLYQTAALNCLCDQTAFPFQCQLLCMRSSIDVSLLFMVARLSNLAN